MEEARGNNGFGYDPILYIPEKGRTAAELPEEEKNAVSHRGKAGKAIARLLAGG
jgi:XTP/dITP diphosphohydrolase